MTEMVPRYSLKTGFGRALTALFVVAVLRLVVPVHAQTFNPDGATHDSTKQSGWALPPVNPAAANYNNCLQCHQAGGPPGASDKSAYLLGGHKNMSRVADGQPWNMPGVDATHVASSWLLDASLDPKGFFTNLWIQEEYVRPLANWLTASGAAPSSVSGGYCAKNAAGDIGSDDVPDLKACPTCESPVMGNGNAGYPLNYPDAATCAQAALNTGKPYLWTSMDRQPLYWIYGGAGLEGGPAMIERGSQQYKCGRCHTTGWSANQGSDSVIAAQTRRPYSDFPSAGLASATTLGATSKLLGPSFGPAGYPVIKSPCTAGTDCDVTSIVLTAKGALYPTSAPATVALSDTSGTGCTATAAMAADAYGTTYKVNSIAVDCSASNHLYTSAAKISISHPYSVSSWDQWGIQCSRCHSGATDGNHGNTTLAAVKGGDIVALCMGCHRMESDTAPRSIQGGNGFAANSGFVLPYTNKQQQPDGFAHHPDGNEFLNSPHARLTGNWKDIGCPPYAIFGYAGVDPGKPGAPAAGTDCTQGTMNLDGKTTSLYASKFAQAAKVDLHGVSDATAGSCDTCHDVHQPLNQNTPGMGGSVKTECTSCHSSSTAKVSPQVSVGTIRHIGGPGTPFADAAEDPSSACITCHQPPGIKHLWRINTDPNYTTYGDYTYAFPVNGAAAQSTGANAPGLVNTSHTAPDGSYSNAVWVDLDNACGQCHGGGVLPRNAVTTGSITAGGSGGFINPLTVTNILGFASGKEVTIAGAGWAGADFQTIIAKVVPDAPPLQSGNVYLTYPAVTSVTHANVTVAGNPQIPEAPYFTRQQLSVAAKGIHGGSLLTAAIAYTRSANKFTFEATNYLCPNTPCAVAWDFGDGTKGSSTPVSHDYGAASNNNKYTVVLSVTDAIGAKTSAAISFTVYPASAHPYADRSDSTWTFTQPGSPTSIDVTFAGQTKVETGFDYIYVMDKSGKNIAGSPFTGIALAGATKTVAGDTVKIRLTSDSSLTDWGFAVTKVTGLGGTPPTATISSPASGTFVVGTTRVTAVATDDAGVSRMELYIDGNLAASAASTGLSYQWNTSNAGSGTHTLVSKVYDAAGNVRSSVPVSVTVITADPSSVRPGITRHRSSRSHSG
ncbi:MAG: Ig-like domain-containing protein [Acidobacteriota bacterium]